MSDFIIDIGKFKGQNIKNLLISEFCYFTWLNTHKKNIAAMQPGLKDYLIKYLPSEDEIGYVIKFGKYKNFSLEEVFKKDQKYILWLKDAMKDNKDSEDERKVADYKLFVNDLMMLEKEEEN